MAPKENVGIKSFSFPAFGYQKRLDLSFLDHVLTMPSMPCNGNGVLPHLQMGVAVMEFVEDFC